MEPEPAAMAYQPNSSVLWPPSRLSSSMRIWMPSELRLRWRVLTQSPPVWVWICETTTGLVIGAMKETSIQFRPVWWSQPLLQPHWALHMEPPAQRPPVVAPACRSPFWPASTTIQEKVSAGLSEPLAPQMAPTPCAWLGMSR